MKNNIQRCSWCLKTPQYIKYHDTEWGVPLHDDTKLFEFLILETFQAGLSWLTILNKRENFKKAFSLFDPKKVAKFTEQDYEKLINNAGIVRNKLKIRAAINNAKKFLEVQKEFGSFDNYIWKFVNYKPIKNSYTDIKQVPAKNKIAETLSNDLKKRGFKFVGPTVIYAHMQATGMVNDHLASCFRYGEM